MRLSNTDEVRISILLTLAIGEVIGFLHFFGQPKLGEFIVVSLAGVLLTIPLLWIEVIHRRGISYFDISLSILICVTMIACWKESNLLSRFIIACAPILFSIRILRRLLRPAAADQQGNLARIIRNEDMRIGRIFLNTAGLITCILLTLGMVSGRASVLWAIPLVVPAAWFGWRLILHLFVRRDNKNEADGFIESATNQGGRA